MKLKSSVALHFRGRASRRRNTTISPKTTTAQPEILDINIDTIMASQPTPSKKEPPNLAAEVLLEICRPIVRQCTTIISAKESAKVKRVSRPKYAFAVTGKNHAAFGYKGDLGKAYLEAVGDHIFKEKQTIPAIVVDFDFTNLQKFLRQLKKTKDKQLDRLVDFQVQNDGTPRGAGRSIVISHIITDAFPHSLESLMEFANFTKRLVANMDSGEELNIQHRLAECKDATVIERMFPHLESESVSPGAQFDRAVDLLGSYHQKEVKRIQDEKECEEHRRDVISRMIPTGELHMVQNEDGEYVFANDIEGESEDEEMDQQEDGTAAGAEQDGGMELDLQDEDDDYVDRLVRGFGYASDEENGDQMEVDDSSEDSDSEDDDDNSSAPGYDIEIDRAMPRGGSYDQSGQTHHQAPARTPSATRSPRCRLDKSS